MQLNPPIHVLTPLGEGLAFLLEDGRSGVEWQVFIKRTGESWWFRNLHIRLAQDATEAIGPVSEFTLLGPLLERHVKRYQENGWLEGSATTGDGKS